MSRRHRAASILAMAWMLAGIPPASAHRASAASKLDLRPFRIELPGPPVSILSADLNGDGRGDLITVQAFTFWGESTSFGTEMRDGRLWQSVEVVPTLLERREIQLFLGRTDGGFTAAAPPQELPAGFLALDRGPRSHPVVALTRAGLSEVRLQTGASDTPLRFRQLLDQPPAMAGTENLLPGFRFTADVDGDSQPEILFPGQQGLVIYRLTGEGPERLQGPIPLPGDEAGRDGVAWRHYPLPQIRDVTGDGISDLVFTYADRSRPLVRLPQGTAHGAIAILRGRGDGTFHAAVPLHYAPPADSPPPTPLQALERLLSAELLPGTLATFADMDGDGVAELVTSQEEEPDGKSGLRREMRQVKRPRYTHRFYRIDEELKVSRTPHQVLTAQGYPFTFDWIAPSSGGFLDVDGDGKPELITVDLDFSLWQAPKILIARTVGAGLDFHIWRQDDGGNYGEVPGGRLRGKLKVNLRHLRLVEFAQVAGDFDGDGHLDFLRLGGGRQVAIHRGQGGGRFPARPDLTFDLLRAPQDTALAEVRDVDGDGRSDLMVITVLDADESGATRPTRVEFYLTGDGS